MSKPVVLILGAGANVGTAVARKFSQDGYQVAVSARRIANGISPEGYITIQADLSEKTAVPQIFEKVKSAAGIPSVVIYNAATFTPPPSNAPLSLSPEALDRDIWVNTHSAIIAADHAVRGFEQLPETATKTFIYTGNWLNKTISASSALLTLGVGKAASAYWIGSANQTYSQKGYRFYYADQRTPEGTSMRTGVDGEAHAEFFKQLADWQDPSVPWLATFVKGKGYVNFSP
ncbi:uncharacterized protein ATNIH1004_003687 [Aspergillus tanneri]|uniref:Uncharacterized protein n=1 Tax=Aspergillus tanneri TaxID=1220188 RepID=A0A5M9MYF6_9EURO|nr:uncharacterized protein ATNIH1004_003687 [Aspergillus tanneri]KAA8650996.1 hypothetical protein ATNIH1004_003687 [Aspergillus tanneri]